MDGQSRSHCVLKIVAVSLLALFSVRSVFAQANAAVTADDGPALSAPARATSDAELRRGQTLTVLTAAPDGVSAASAPANLTFTPMSAQKSPAAEAVQQIPAAPIAVPPIPAAPVAAPAPVAAAPVDSLPPTPTSPIEQQAIRKPSTAASAMEGSKVTTPASVPSGLQSAGQVAAALTVVIGLIFLGRGLARKFVPGVKGSGTKGVIEILARHPLSKNQSIVLVRIGSQIVALNQGKDQSQSVLVISDQTEVARLMGQIDGQGPKSIQTGFNRLLANAAIDLRDEANDPDRDSASIDSHSLDDQLEEMAAARRQLMDLRTQVRGVRDKMPRG